MSSMLSLIIGAVLGLTQSRIKRLYAYSTISHIGFILLALSINSIESVQSFIFYLIQYSLSNLNAFILLVAIGYSLYMYVEDDKSLKRKSNYNVGEHRENKAQEGTIIEDREKGDIREQIDNDKELRENFLLSESLSDKNNSPLQLVTQLKGYFYINPILALSLAITIFSFIGIPPLVGFFAKQMVLSSALDNGYVFMAFIAILSSVISAYYYLVLVKQIFFNKSEYIVNPVLESISLKANIVSKYTQSNVQTFNANTKNIQLSSSIAVVISVLTLMILLFIINPKDSLNIVTIVTLIMFNC